MISIYQAGNLVVDATIASVRWTTSEPRKAKRIATLQQALVRQIEEDFSQSWGSISGATMAFMSRPISPTAEDLFMKLKAGLDAPWTLN